MKTEIENDTMIVSGVRDLTANTTADIRKEIRRQFAPNVTNIEFRFDEAGFLDSSGLGALLSMQKLAVLRDGWFRIVNPPAAVVQVLELTQLHRILTIVRD